MTNIFKHHYFAGNDYIEISEVFGPLRRATSDTQIVKILAEMEREGKAILGGCFTIRLDETIGCRDIMRRVRMTKLVPY